MPSRKGRSRRYWYVFAAELDPLVKQLPEIMERNPHCLSGRPAVYVGYLFNEPPERRYPDGDFDGSRNYLLREYGRMIIDGLTTRHTKKEECLLHQLQRIEDLQDEGWCVVNPEPVASHNVYIVELQPAIADRADAKRLNPDRDPSMPCVYVGQSSKTPEERLQDHLERRHGSKFVTPETVVGLRPDLYETVNPLTELQSLMLERKVAETLRAAGWTVVGGH